MLWQFKVRTNRDQPKYLAISGGHPCLFGAETLVPGEPALLAEGDVDTRLLWQAGGRVRDWVRFELARLHGGR